MSTPWDSIMMSPDSAPSRKRVIRTDKNSENGVARLARTKTSLASAARVKPRYSEFLDEERAIESLGVAGDKERSAIVKLIWADLKTQYQSNLDKHVEGLTMPLGASGRRISCMAEVGQFVENGKVLTLITNLTVAEDNLDRLARMVEEKMLRHQSKSPKKHSARIDTERQSIFDEQARST